MPQKFSDAAATVDAGSTKNIALTTAVANMKFLANLVMRIHSLPKLSVWNLWRGEDFLLAAAIVVSCSRLARYVTRCGSDGHSRENFLARLETLLDENFARIDLQRYRLRRAREQNYQR